MRPAHRSLLAAVLMMTLLAACAEQASGPEDPTGPELATRIDHNNDRLDFSLLDVDNPCTPVVEAIDLEGTIHGQGAIWDNDHFNSHFNVNLTGVDADGVRYMGISTGNGNVPDPIEDMVISRLIVSNGGLPNFISKIVLHHHQDGTVTVDKAGVECRG